MKPLDRPHVDANEDAHRDHRLYVPNPEGWTAQLKIGWDKLHCYAKNPGEDYFHALMHGEIYLQNGHEKLCLNCAIRQGVISTDRLFWQRKSLH